MQIERNAMQSIFAKIQEILVDEGFDLTSTPRTATITMAYPKKDDLQTIIKPLIIVNNLAGNDFAVELGSNDATRIMVDIDVYAKDDGQRDDLGYVIRKGFRNKSLAVYNFDDGFPSSIGNYSGISTRGKMTIISTQYNNLDPQLYDTQDLGHHQVITLDIILPVDIT